MKPVPHSPPVEQHNIEIQSNRDAWNRKPLLQAAYRSLHRQVAARLRTEIAGLTVELGSGMGSIKETIPDCITTDIFPNPWLDRRENAYALSFIDGSVSNLILFDVWHHLRYPGTALREFHRALAPGGRVILVEPAMSWTGRFIYGLMHHEPLGFGEQITWDAPPDFSAANADYYACQSSSTRLFWNGEAKDRLAGWTLLEVRPLAAFSYLATGGFSGPQLYSRKSSRLVGFLDRLADKLPRVFAARLVIVLEKSLSPG